MSNNAITIVAAITWFAMMMFIIKLLLMIPAMFWFVAMLLGIIALLPFSVAERK